MASTGYGKGQYRIGADTGMRGLIKRQNTNITDASVKVVNVGTRGAMNMARILAHGLQQEMQDKSELAKLHRRVAADMRESVKSSFEQTVHSKPGQYRMGDKRISGGKLKRAIMASSLAVGTEEGIFFVDEYRLSREAKHWRRLNFGAVGTAVTGREAKRFPFRFDDVTLYTVGFPDGATPSFGLPPGFFEDASGEKVDRSTSRRGMDKFIWVKGGKAMHPGVRKVIDGPMSITRGIKPRNFLDAGLRRMVKELPPAYEKMIKGWLDDAEKAIKLPPIVNVRAGLGQNPSTGQITQVNP